MSKAIKVIFGSTTGNTQRAAEAIVAKLGGSAINIASAKADDFNADLLILGCSTWGYGELQDDWLDGMPLLEAANLAERKVALFGLGDASGFADTFLDGMGVIAEKVKDAGGVIVGCWSKAGYSHSGSTAEDGENFVGLALDDDNEPGETDGRIDRWCEQLTAEAGL